MPVTPLRAGLLPVALCVLCLLSGGAWADVAASTCAEAAGRAETAAGIPAGLLLAIGKAESGRFDPLTRQVVPWPYAINVAGEGRYFANAAAATAEVVAAQARGVRSIDVGCFQISLLHHPEAFASLAEAFEPVSNAAYAARFLSALRSGLPSWEVAAGHYHSATPGLSEPYAARVMALWSGADLAAAEPPVASPVRTLRPPGTRAGSAVLVFWPGDQRGARLAVPTRLPMVYSPGMR